MQRDGQLAAGAHIEAEAFLVDPPCYFGAQERLAGIVHILATTECRRDLTAPRAEVVFVDNEQRRAVLMRQRGQWNTSDADRPVSAAKGVARPDIRRQPQEFLRCLRPRWNTGVMDLFCVPRAGRMGVHIRSGALTPRMANPLAMT